MTDQPTPVVLPTHDLAFKKLLASPDHKTVAQGFIQTFFDLNINLADIAIVNPYAIIPNPDHHDPHRLIETFRDITFTVPVADLTVELQVRRLAHFEARALYYTFDLFTSHFHEPGPPTPDSHRHYASLRPVYSVNVLKYAHFDCRHAVHMFEPTDTLWPDEALKLDWWRAGFVEIHRDKTEFATETQRLWCQFLATGQAPPGAPDYLDEAANMISYMNLTREEQAVIDLAVKHEADRAAEIEWAEEHGKTIGETIGEARGEARGEDRTRRRLARRAFDQGLSADQITRLFEIPADEVAAWGEPPATTTTNPPPA